MADYSHFKPTDESATLYTSEGMLTMHFRLTKNDRNRWRLGISASTPNSAGQILDIARKVAKANDLPKLAALCVLWKDHHLNDMRPTKDGKSWGHTRLPYDTLESWMEAKAEIEEHNAKRAAAMAEAEENEERDAFETVAEERGIDETALRELAANLGIGADEAAAYHEENYAGSENAAEWAEQMAEDIGAIDRNATWPKNHIDWEAAAQELLQSDYFQLDCGAIYRNA
jgi:hypothetical protein